MYKNVGGYIKDFIRDDLEFKVVKSYGLTVEEAFERSGIKNLIIGNEVAVIFDYCHELEDETYEKSFNKVDLVSSGVVDYVTCYLAPVREVEREYYFFGWM